MITRIKNWLSTTFAPELRRQVMTAMFQYIGGGAPMWIGDSPKEYVDNGYASNADLYAIVEKILKYAKEVRIGLKQGEKEIYSHKALDLLEYPNPILNNYHLFQDTVLGYALLTGNSYIYHVSADVGLRKGQPLELWVLPSQEVEIISGGDMQPVGGYRLTYMAEVLPASKTAHLRFWNPIFEAQGQAHLYGFSPVRAGRKAVSMSTAQYDASTSLLQNGGTKGIISGDKQGEYSEEQMGALRNKFYEKGAGSANAGKIVFTSADLKYLNLAMKATDLDLVAGMKMTVRQLCNLYGLPSALMNDNDASTYNNLLEMKKAAYQDCVLPLMRAILLPYLNRYVAKSFGEDLEFFLDTSRIDSLQSNKKEMVDYMVAAECFTKNEIREALDYDAIDEPEYNTVYVSTNKLPIHMTAVTEDGIKQGEDDVNNK
jgi:HK97 family phage portal protein